MRSTSLFVAFAVWGACGDNGWRGPMTYTTELVQYDSCAALEQDLKAMLVADADTRIEQRSSPIWAFGGRGAQEGAAPASGRQEGKDYSGTNNQETGVDEADFVKTDGYHVYVLNGNRLHILGVPTFGDLVPESVTAIEGNPREMLFHRNVDERGNETEAKAVVFSQIYPYALPVGHPLRAELDAATAGGGAADLRLTWRIEAVTKLTVLDISDRTNPRLVREIFVEGDYQTARRVDASVRMGAYSWMLVPGIEDAIWRSSPSGTFDPSQARRAVRAYVAGLDLSDLIPRLYERLPDRAFRTIAISTDRCRSFYRPTQSHGRGVSSLLTLDLFSASFHFDADFVVTNRATFYASPNRLYLAEQAHDWWWFWWNDDHVDQTNIHVFDTSIAGQSIYQGSGRVEGYLHNQFSMGEHKGHLRAATTSNRWARWWSENRGEAENHVFVLTLDGGRLETVGHVGGIAKGEQIFSARFIGDRGYMVTFRQIDPLFTLDLSDPTAPRVVGELKIPGFSTYLHPISDDRLLAIGVGGDETGANWRTQVSLFDVSQFDQPRLFDIEQLLVAGEWGSSEALYEHKAFQYWAPKKLLAVPLSSYSQVPSPQMYPSYRYTSRLELITVDLAAGLSRYGAIDHSHLFNSDPDRYWYRRDVRRSIFMGDYIYAISDRGISSHLTADLSLVREQLLPGYSPEDSYWWW